MILIRILFLRIHTITNFKMTGGPTKSGIATTYNGTATFTAFMYFSVPISIKIMGRAMRLLIGDRALWKYTNIRDRS
jgi:hypothetical protein